jgi:hypothetical protein
MMPVAALLAIRRQVVRRRLGTDLLLQAVESSHDLVNAAHRPILAAAGVASATLRRSSLEGGA